MVEGRTVAHLGLFEMLRKMLFWMKARIVSQRLRQIAVVVVVRGCGVWSEIGCRSEDLGVPGEK